MRPRSAPQHRFIRTPSGRSACMRMGASGIRAGVGGSYATRCLWPAAPCSGMEAPSTSGRRTRTTCRPIPSRRPGAPGEAPLRRWRRTSSLERGAPFPARRGRPTIPCWQESSFWPPDGGQTTCSSFGKAAPCGTPGSSPPASPMRPFEPDLPPLLIPVLPAGVLVDTV